MEYFSLSITVYILDRNVQLLIDFRGNLNVIIKYVNINIEIIL